MIHVYYVQYVCVIYVHVRFMVVISQVTAQFLVIRIHVVMVEIIDCCCYIL